MIGYSNESQSLLSIPLPFDWLFDATGSFLGPLLTASMKEGANLGFVVPLSTAFDLIQRWRFSLLLSISPNTISLVRKSCTTMSSSRPPTTPNCLKFSVKTPLILASFLNSFLSMASAHFGHPLTMCLCHLHVKHNPNGACRLPVAKDAAEVIPGTYPAALSYLGAPFSLLSLRRRLALPHRPLIRNL